jgi:hypothetical protein
MLYVVVFGIVAVLCFVEYDCGCGDGDLVPLFTFTGVKKGEAMIDQKKVGDLTGALYLF